MKNNELSIKELSVQLESLCVGQRGWFWLCTHVSSELAPFAFLAFDEGHPDEFYQSLSKIHLPLHAIPYIGVGVVDEQGRLNLASHLFGVEQERDLERIACWVGENCSKHPGLARFKDLQLIQIGEDRSITKRWKNSALWEHIPSVTVPRIALKELLRCKKIKKGTTAWFWMTDKGLDGHPMLVLRSSKKTASEFTHELQQGRFQAVEGACSVVGVLEYKDDWLLQSKDESEDMKRILTLLSEEYPDVMSVLSHVRMQKFSDAGLVDECFVGFDPNIQRLGELIKNLSVGDDVFFWCTAANRSGMPAVLWDDDKENLKTRAKTEGVQGESFRGVLSKDATQRLIFAVKRDATLLAKALQLFWEQHVIYYPEIATIKDIVAYNTTTKESTSVVI